MARRGPKPKKTEYYVDPVEFKQQLVEYYKTDIIPTELADHLNKIAKGLSYASNFVNYCVDEHTLALTTRGWLSYKEIKTTDTILSYKDGTLTWSPISEIFINSSYEGKMFKLVTKGMDALVTPGHKFMTKEEGLTPVEYIKSQDHLILMGRHIDSNTIPTTISDDFVRIVGWSVTEGHYMIQKRTHTIVISQKKGEKADKIRKILTSLGARFKEYIQDDYMVKFRVTKDTANNIISAAPRKILSHEFILSLSQEQRMILIKTMIDGDGWIRKQVQGKYGEKLTNWSYCQKDKEHVNSFLMLVTLAGLTSTTRLVGNISDFSKNPFYVTNIYSKPKLQCKSACINFFRGRSKNGGDNRSGKLVGKISKPNTPTIDYKGVVWCPKTLYGSFICMRNGTIYLTGNTYKDEMVGDAIVKMYTAIKNKKFDIRTEYSPFSYFTTIAFNAFINRIKKEKKHHETLNQYKEMMYEQELSENCGNGIYVKPSHGSDSSDEQ